MKCPCCNGMGQVRGDSRSEADKVIERYYRDRSSGAKVTLKKLAEDAGLSYAYVRQVKMRYHVKKAKQ